MKKKLLGALALASIALQSAVAQSPWVAPATGPLYDYPYGGGGFTVYIHSPQPNVLWGLVREVFSGGPGKQNYQDRVYSTADNGQTWQEAPKVQDGSSWLPQVATYDLTAVDAQHAWFLRRSTFNNIRDFGLYRTTTGPTGFSKLAAVLPVEFADIHFFTATIGIAMGMAPASAISWPIYRTTDGGLTWAPVPNPPAKVVDTIPVEIYNKRRVGSALWLSAGRGQLLRTSDMGLTWTATPNGSDGVFESELRGLRFRQTTVGSVTTYIMQRTSDGGLTWTDTPYTGKPGQTSMTAIAGRLGTYLSYSYIFPGASNLANGTTTVSYDWGASWQVLDTNIMSGIMEKFVSQYPGQLWAGLQGGGGPPMVMQYSGLLLDTKKSGNPALALSAYPNPTSSTVCLAGPLQGQETAQLYDAAGRLCQVTTVSQAQPTVDLSPQPAGLYQLRVTSASGAVRHLRVSKTQ